ncbi:MAG: sugar porter (SP) family MFS transporter [Actinomycetes bacterium]|jgi:SP family sugar:H+ symporter-like MFS transporter
MQDPVDSPTGASKLEESRTAKVVGIAIIAALGGFLFGYDSAVINGANQAVYHEFNITNTSLQGFIVAVALLGSAVGALACGGLADRMGRRKVMLLSAILFLVAGVGQAIPFGALDFIFWRTLGGFAIGLAAVVCPMYISEIAPAHLRGRLTSLFQFGIVVGIFSTQFVNQLLLSLAGGPTEFPAAAPGQQPLAQANNEFWFGLQTWQWMFLLMVVPALVYFLLATTLPESPRYLVAKGRDAAAKVVLEKIFIGDVKPKLERIEASLDSEHKPSFKDIKGSSFGLEGIVWIGIILAVFQQFVGINAVFYYSNIVFQAVGFTTEDAFKQSTIISAINVIFTVVAIATIDRLGRRRLLLIGSCGMFVTLGILTLLFATAPKATEAVGQIAVGDPLLSSTNGWIAVVALNTYVAFFAATWGPILWVLLGEMFTNKIRAMAMSVGVMSNWIANFIVSETFPTLVSVSIGLAYGIFTVCAFLSFFYVLKYVKETKGAELEDMEQVEGAKEFT